MVVEMVLKLVAALVITLVAVKVCWMDIVLVSLRVI